MFGLDLKSIVPKMLPMFNRELKKMPENSIVILSSAGTTLINGISLSELKKLLIFCENKGIVSEIEIQGVSKEQIEQAANDIK